MMTTREVADYLRLKERKIYELVAVKAIPCTRITGKWLFPKSLIDLWILDNTDCPASVPRHRERPLVLAGSHDPLLEWAVSESTCDLAILFNGSLDGLHRFADGRALVCGLHLRHPDGSYNVSYLKTLSGFWGIAMEWAKRQQGLIVPQNNPRRLRGIEDLLRPDIRVVLRQPEAGSHVLLCHLLAEKGFEINQLLSAVTMARNQIEVAMTVASGKADVGLGVAAVVHNLPLSFIDLHKERYDLVLNRRDYFEAPMQRLIAFTRTPIFRERAAEFPGYDIDDLGKIHYNAL